MFNNFYLIAADVPAYDQIWLIGDKFLSDTFNDCIQKSDKYYYMKEQFEVQPIFTEKRGNYIARIRNTLVTAMNDIVLFPKYIIVITDADYVTEL